MGYRDMSSPARALILSLPWAASWRHAPVPAGQQLDVAAHAGEVGRGTAAGGPVGRRELCPFAGKLLLRALLVFHAALLRGRQLGGLRTASGAHVELRGDRRDDRRGRPRGSPKWDNVSMRHFLWESSRSL